MGGAVNGTDRFGHRSSAGFCAAALRGNADPREPCVRWHHCRSRRGFDFPAANSDPLFLYFAPRGHRLHGARGVSRGQTFQLVRAQRPEFRAAPFQLRLRDSRRDGRAHALRSESPPDHDFDGPVHELLGPPARLHPAHRNLYRAHLWTDRGGVGVVRDALRRPRARTAPRLGAQQIFPQAQAPAVHSRNARLPRADPAKHLPPDVGAGPRICRSRRHRHPRFFDHHLVAPLLPARSGSGGKNHAGFCRPSRRQFLSRRRAGRTR